MGYDFRFAEDLNICIVNFTEVLDKPTLNQFLEDLIIFLRTAPCKTLLYDLRTVTSLLETIDLFELAQRVEAIGLNKQYKRALLVDGVKGGALFYEIVTSAEGYPVKAFTDWDEAITWLGSE